MLWYTLKAPAKRSQHANATYRIILGRNILRAFGPRVATCCDILGVVGSSLKMVKFESTAPNMSQQGGQTHATKCQSITVNGKDIMESDNLELLGVTIDCGLNLICILAMFVRKLVRE